MSERALSEAAMLASLRDIHLPADAPGGALADLGVVIGGAALAALLAVAVLRGLSTRRPRPTAHSLRRELDALRTMPEAARRVALLHVLRAHAPERFEQVKGALYEPGGGVDLPTLEAEVARLV